MAGNSEMIDQLVSKEALDSLDNLNKKLGSSYLEMEKLLAQIQELNKEFSRSGMNWSEFTKAAEKANKTFNDATKVCKEYNEAEKEIKKVTDDVIYGMNDQSKAYEKQEQAAKKLNLTNQQLINLSEKMAKGIDISSYITENEKGMKNYSSAIGVLNTQIGQISGLQEELNERLKQGVVSQEDYNKATSALAQAQTQQEQQLESLTQQYEKTNEAQNKIFNISGEAFGQLSPEIQKMTITLVEENKVLNDIRNAQKELDNEYKKGLITTDEYTQKKAELNNLEKLQAESVKNLSKELQLNQQIANTTVGSYENLSAQYSLLKIQINALGEAEGKDAEEKRKLEMQAKSLYEQMNELQKATGKAQLQVGDYTMINKELEGSLNKLNPALGRFISGAKEAGGAIISFLTTPIGVCIAAVTALIGVVKLWWNAQSSNINTGRDFKAMMDGMNEALDYAKTAFANIDFTDFLHGLSEAARLGNEASIILQELFEIRNSFTLTSKTERAELEEMKTEMRDANKTYGERIGIADKVIAKTKEIRKEEREIQKIEVEGYKLKLEAQTNLTDSEKEYVITNYNANREQISNAKELIKLEKELSGFKSASSVAKPQGTVAGVNTQAIVSENKEVVSGLEMRIEKLKESKSYSEEAYNAWKKYAMADEEHIEGYVKAREKLIDIDISEQRELRMTDRMRNSLIKSQTREAKAARKEAARASKRRMEEEKRERNKDIKAQAELETFEYLKAADIQKKLSENEKLSFDERRYAFREYIDDSIAAIEKKAEEEVKTEGLTQQQIKLIRLKALYEIFKLEEKYGEGIKNLNIKEAKKQVDDVKEAITERSEAINNSMQKDLVLSSKVYDEMIRKNLGNEEKRKEITKDYQIQRLKIIREYNQQQFNEEVAMLNKLLESTDLSEKEKSNIRKQINKLQIQEAKEVADYEITITEDKLGRMLTSEEKFNKFLNDKRTKAVLSMWSIATDIANSYYDNELQRIDELARKERDYWSERTKLIDDSVQSGLMSQEYADERKKVIDAEQMQREKEIDNNRREMQRKQAVWQKANAIVQAIMSTAQGVAAALPNVVLAAIAGAIGFAQVAIITAQKIPSYREGTREHPGGLALVGDGGRSEMAILPDGKVWKTPDRDTLTLLPKGTEVLPDYRKAIERAAIPELIKGNNDNQFIYIYDSRQAKLLEESNSKLSQMNNGIRAIRDNSKYAMQVERRKRIFAKW